MTQSILADSAISRVSYRQRLNFGLLASGELAINQFSAYLSLVGALLGPDDPTPCALSEFRFRQVGYHPAL